MRVALDNHSHLNLLCLNSNYNITWTKQSLKFQSVDVTGNPDTEVNMLYAGDPPVECCTLSCLMVRKY